MATKYKKGKDGRYSAFAWDGTYNPDGTKHRKKLTSKKSSADLERIVAEYKNKVMNSGQSVYTDLSFYEYAREWLEVSKSAREENTRAMYRNIIETHLSGFTIPVTAFTHSHFQQAVNAQLGHPRTCEQIYLTVKQIIKAAVRDHILPRNAVEDICTDISMPKYKKPSKRPLTALERECLMTADLDARKRAFVSILYYCGLRRGEALALQKDDFCWDKGEVSVTKTIIFNKNNGRPSLKDYPKSDNGIRKVPIPESGIGQIRPFVEDSRGKFIFHGRENEMMTLSAFIRMWQSVTLAMNVAAGYNPNAKKDRGEKPITGLTPHIFRHNYCTELCYRVPAISTKMIARMLGDTEKMVLEVYSHIVEEKENVSETLNSIF